ncbi:MAG: hypothetical protein GX575_28000 [Candidatus Anammoximicrobium sp.]|nr:hypothetical protein [Candidatus Anammoximicrobium sp.]
MSVPLRCLGAMLLTVSWASIPVVGADSMADKTQEIDALNESVSDAARLFKQGKYKDCADAVRSAQQKFEELAAGGDAGLAAALTPIYDRLSKAHSLLELEGVTLPPLKKLETSETPPEAAGISFASDIAPLLVEKCLNCHGGDRERRPSARLSLVTFVGLMRGGVRGPTIAAGDAAGSLLVRKLKGTADGERMPKDQPPLSDAEVAKIEQWIAAGAKFDGPNERQDLAQLKPPAKTDPAAKTDVPAAADDATAAREQAALKTWELALPGSPAARAETKHFLLLGNVSEPTLQQNGELAESRLPKIAEFLVASDPESLIPGRVTLFLLAKREDYAQFGTNTEQRTPPAEWSGHWTGSAADGYGVSLVPPGGEYSMEALLMQQLTGLCVANLGAVPRWFAEGAGRAAAARLLPDDARVKAWDSAVPAVAASFQRADDFQTGKTSPESADVASYSFVKLLLIDARRWRTLLDGVRSGQDFDATFAAAYGSGPSQVAEIWAKRIAAGLR